MVPTLVVISEIVVNLIWALPPTLNSWNLLNLCKVVGIHKQDFDQESDQQNIYIFFFKEERFGILLLKSCESLYVGFDWEMVWDAHMKSWEIVVNRLISKVWEPWMVEIGFPCNLENQELLIKCLPPNWEKTEFWETQTKTFYIYIISSFFGTITHYCLSNNCLCSQCRLVNWTSENRTVMHFF